MTRSFQSHTEPLLRRIALLSTQAAAAHGVGQHGRYFDIQDVFYRFTFDTIGEIAYGISAGCLEQVHAPFPPLDFAQIATVGVLFPERRAVRSGIRLRAGVCPGKVFESVVACD
jgi:hypothetical protein